MTRQPQQKIKTYIPCPVHPMAGIHRGITPLRSPSGRAKAKVIAYCEVCGRTLASQIKEAE